MIKINLLVRSILYNFAGFEFKVFVSYTKCSTNSYISSAHKKITIKNVFFWYDALS